MPNETPNLDKLADEIMRKGSYTNLLFFKEERIDLIEAALIETRNIIKYARIGATNVPREGT